MHLFIETAEMRARSRDARETLSRTGSIPHTGTDAAAGPARPGMGDAPAPSRGASSPYATSATPHTATAMPPEARRDVDAALYSLEQETYQKELAFAERRARRSKARAALRVFAIAVAVPVALVVMFVAAYALAGILDGVTPDAFWEYMGELPARVGAVIGEVSRALPFGS